MKINCQRAESLLSQYDQALENYHRSLEAIKSCATGAAGIDRKDLESRLHASKLVMEHCAVAMNRHQFEHGCDALLLM